MKKIVFLFSLLINCFILYSEVPDAFNYQAVVRNTSGDIIANTNVSLRISILQDSESGTTVYSELHHVTTNNFGLVNLVIGKGEVLFGIFLPSGWGISKHFIKVELDPKGGDSFVHLGTMQLLSVPYAFHAQTVEEDMVEDDDADPTNEIQTLNLSDNNLTLSRGGGTVEISSQGSDNLGNHTATQNIHLNNNWLSGDGDNEGISVGDDGNVKMNSLGTGALLNLGNSANLFSVLKLTASGIDRFDAAMIQFGKEDDNYLYKMGLRGLNDSENNNFKLLYHTLNPSNFYDALGIYPKSLNSPDYSIGLHNDNFYISDSGNIGIGTLFPQSKLEVSGLIHSSSGGIKFPDGTVQTTAATGSGNGGGDNWGTQTIVSDATLSGLGTSAEPLHVVGDLTDDQTLSLAGSELTISGGNTVLIPTGSTDADTDSTNELQTISLSGTLLTLSDEGGTVTLPSSGEGGDNWGTQVAQTNATISGDGSPATPLGVVHNQVLPEWGNIQNMPAGFADNTDNVDDADHDPENEIQTLSIIGNQLTLSDGGGVINLPEGSSVWEKNESDIYYNDGNVGIGTNTPAALLHVEGTGTGEGNVLFTGEWKEPVGDPPASGHGTRMMWYPDKAAFRAGAVGDTRWNANNINWYSTAFGYDCQASGVGSTAMGQSTVASGSRSTAMGGDTEASGQNSFATGNHAIASGDYSTAMGSYTVASGGYSTALGWNTTASSYCCTALGMGNIGGGSNGWLETDPLFEIGNSYWNNPNPHNAMTVLKNGNTGIGIANPAYLLDVDGEVTSRKKNAFRLRQGTYSVILRNDNDAFYLLLTDADNPDGDWNSLRPFSVNMNTGNVSIGVNSNVGVGTYTPGYKLQVGNAGDGTQARANAWNTLSDARLKRDFQSINDPLEMVEKIKGYYFNWNIGSDKTRQVGFSAQEVQKVLPEVISKGEDGYLSIEYGKMTPLLLEAIKELKAENDKLKEENKLINSRLENLETLISIGLH